MTRLHPDDIQAIAERVVCLLAPASVSVVSSVDYVSPADEARIRLMARQNMQAKALKRAGEVSRG